MSKVVVNSFEQAAQLLIAQTIKDFITAKEKLDVDVLSKAILSALEDEFDFSIDDTKIKYEYACKEPVVAFEEVIETAIVPVEEDCDEEEMY